MQLSPSRAMAADRLRANEAMPASPATGTAVGSGRWPTIVQAAAYPMTCMMAPVLQGSLSELGILAPDRKNFSAGF